MFLEVVLGFVGLIWLLNMLKGPMGLVKVERYPPGPWGFPILGYMPYFGYKPLERLQSLASRYGEICSMHLGSYRVVMLNSYYTIREAFKEDAFSGRPALKMLEVRNCGVNVGLVCSEGRVWMEQRKFCMKQLRDLGFGKRSMEGLLIQEVDELISWMGEKVGTPVDLKARLNLAVLNALWSIICGQRYSHDDVRLQKIVNKTSADLSETEYTGPLLFLPWLVKFVPSLTRWKDFVHSVSGVHAFLQEIITEHKQQRRLKGNGTTEDFIDFFLKEIEATKDPSSSFYQKRGEHSLLIVLLDLFMAGADTTSATLYWAFLFMVLHEDVQKKVHHEIDSVLGNVPPSLEHRKLMPYTEATLQEIMRKSSLVPMGLFHSTVKNTQLLGFDIPKDSVVMANLYNLNYDAGYWGDPQDFRPERFLDEEKAKVVKFERFIPFSTGKRACPGENLARDQLFLFFVGLLQKFIFIADRACPRPVDVPNYGVILSPKPYSVVIRSRVVGGLQ